jgi:ABC-type Zn uptake system ZnuABC Zn-binding protein ZnuA
MILILTTSAALCVTLAACGDDAGRDGPVVAASTGILADIAANVGGDDVEVVQVIPDSASPHDFEPSAQERQSLAEADLIVLNGAGLDASLPVEDTPAWALSEHTPNLLELDGEGVDPHAWMDPSRVAASLPALAEALGEIDPAHRRDFQRRAEDYADRLTQLDREIGSALDEIPAADRELVTSHDALGYFADRYGLEVVATPFPTTGPEAEASAASIADVIDVVERTGTRALFTEETDDPEVLESIANETGAVVVGELLVEAPGSAGTYEAMLRHDGELIADSLGGG